MKLNRGRATMTAPSLSISRRVSAFGKNVKGRDDNGGAESIFPQDMACIENYAAECSSDLSPSVEELKLLSDVLRKATALTSRGEAGKLIGLCNLLPGAIQRTIDCDIAAALSRETDLQAYVFEVLCVLVEFAVASFSTQVGDHLTQAVTLGPSIPKLLEAISIALDTGRQFYHIRRSSGMREILVDSSRLTSVLQVPGFFVRVRGAVNGQVRCYCSQTGVNRSGEACECCAPPPWADAVLVNLCWLLAKTASGSGYEYLLRMLYFPSQHTLPTIELLLRPLVLSLWHNNGCSTWRTLAKHIEVNFKHGFKDVCSDVCSRLYLYLEKMVPASYVKPCPSFDAVIANHKAFSDVLKHLHSITRWGISYYGGSMAFHTVKMSVCKLQERMWEQLFESRSHKLACECIGAAIEDTLPPASGNSLFSLKWLEEKKILLKLLNVRYSKTSVPKVQRLLIILCQKGVVLEENDFFAAMRFYATVRRSITKKDYNPADLIVASMLYALDISAYSVEFLEYALEWLENFKVTRFTQLLMANSAFNESRIFGILSKLLLIDKHRRWEKRFLTLFYKHAAGVSDSELMDCLSKVADHYTSHHEIGPPDDDSYMQTSDGKARLLQACSSADMVTSTSTDVGGALNHTHIYGQKAEAWKDKEIALHITATSKLSKALATGFPFTRHETAKKCLDRLDLAQHLSVDLNPDDSNTLASVMSKAMSPELQTLKALEKESSLHSRVVRQVEQLSEKQMQAYDALRQEQHESLVKFFEACYKEREDVVWDALYEKAKVLADVKRASIDRDEDLSPEDILKRIIQQAGGAFKKVEGKHKESLETAPNNECAVCFSKFSLKRKRACLEPCGHASACIDCTTQEWKRTKTCPICKASIEKPIAVPLKLFF